MNVGDLQQFVGSLASLFAARTGQPQGDMVALGAALEPFKDQSIASFGDFLRAAKEYRDTGKVQAPIQGRRRAAASGAGGRGPLKKLEDSAAIKQAVAELDRLYSHAADPDLTYPMIEASVKQIHDTFDAAALKEVAKRFHLTAGLGSKKACREKIEHKIKERKARNERGEVIADAARSSAQATEPDGEVVEAVPAEAPR